MIDDTVGNFTLFELISFYRNMTQVVNSYHLELCLAFDMLVTLFGLPISVKE